MKYLLITLFLICSSCSPGLDMGNKNQQQEEVESSQTNDQPSSLPSEDASISATESFVKPASLVINEVLYDVKGNELDGNSFIELSGTPLGNLEGYSIQIWDGKTSQTVESIIFKSEDQISESGLFVVCDTATGQKTSHVSGCNHIENFDLPNGPDGLVLLNPQGGVIDSLCYGFGDQIGVSFCEVLSAIDVPEGYSLSRINGLDSQHNWNDFKENQSPSPGTFDVKTNESKLPTESQDGENDSSEEEFESNDDVQLKEVIISEVVTDPQQDWNDSMGGNGILFDAIPGNGSIGPTDEWLELKNISDEAKNISQWSLMYLDGTDEVQVFEPDMSGIYFSGDGSIENLNSEEILVVSNPPGDMKNSIRIILYDELQNVQNEIFIEDGNATSTFDESNSFDADGNYFKTEASILF